MNLNLRQKGGVVGVAIGGVLGLWSLWLALAMGSVSPWGFLSLLLAAFASVALLVGARHLVAAD